MFKKIAVTSATAALLLASALPAFAGEHHKSNKDGNTIKIVNSATVVNNVGTVSNTGFNQVNGEEESKSKSKHHHDSKDSKGGSIETGEAGALSTVGNVVNSNDVSLCGCDTGKKGKGTSVDITNSATVQNNVLTVSNSGFNQVNGGGKIKSGAAYAEADVVNVVNTNVVGQ